jgi:uncharacterized membrane protein YqiK
MIDLLINIGVPAAIGLFGLIFIGVIFARLYHRAHKETAFVRTGLGGQKVIMDGGAIVLPIFHEIIPVNMNTLKLEVSRREEQSLIALDRMRVDVTAEFYVRVKPTEDAIADAAQTLGQRTMQPDSLKELIEGKFVDSLRAVAAEIVDVLVAIHVPLVRAGGAGDVDAVGVHVAGVVRDAAGEQVLRLARHLGRAGGALAVGGDDPRIRP